MVTLVPHNPDWAQAYNAEAHTIRSALPEALISLHHIGSTAIPGILSKPIIDLLGEARDLALIDAHTDALINLGYKAMGAYGIEGRRYFRKTNDQGNRTHHLHIFAQRSAHIERHLAFRDYLRSNSEVASNYASLKAILADRHNASWQTYQDGKEPFIQETEKNALMWYKRIRTNDATDSMRD